MITTALLALAIVTQDQATLRAAPRDSAAQQAALWQGDALEIRGQRMDYLQVYDHRRERAGFIHVSQVRTVSLQPEDAPQLLSVVRFLRESPGAEALGIAYTAAYLKAAPAEAIGAEAFDALGTMAERLARRASMKHGKATSDVISAHMEVASFYGVSFKGYEQGGSMQLCYNGEAFRRVLALPSDAEQRARAALAVTRPDCMSPDLHPQDRFVQDQWRAEVLDKISAAQFAQLSEVSKNRLRLRRAGVFASLAFGQARRAEAPTAAAQRALAELAAVNKLELTDNDRQDYNDAAIRVGASRWAAQTALPRFAKLTLATEAGQARPAKPAWRCMKTRPTANPAKRPWPNAAPTALCGPLPPAPTPTARRWRSRYSRWMRGANCGCFAKARGSGASMCCRPPATIPNSVMWNSRAGCAARRRCCWPARPASPGACAAISKWRAWTP
jgi:hypothetical protein